MHTSIFLHVIFFFSIVYYHTWVVKFATIEKKHILAPATDKATDEATDEVHERRFVYNDLSIFILSSSHQTHSKQYVFKTRLSSNVLFLF